MDGVIPHLVCTVFFFLFFFMSVCLYVCLGLDLGLVIPNLAWFIRWWSFFFCLFFHLCLQLLRGPAGKRRGGGGCVSSKVPVLGPGSACRQGIAEFFFSLLVCGGGGVVVSTISSSTVWYGMVRYTCLHVCMCAAVDPIVFPAVGGPMHFPWSSSQSVTGGRVTWDQVMDVRFAEGYLFDVRYAMLCDTYWMHCGKFFSFLSCLDLAFSLLALFMLLQACWTSIRVRCWVQVTVTWPGCLDPVSGCWCFLSLCLSLRCRWVYCSVILVKRDCRLVSGV